MTTPAAELLAAAEKLRAIATVVGDPDHTDQCGDKDRGECPCIVAQGHNTKAGGPTTSLNYIADAEHPDLAAYIALMHPGVGIAVAGWLEAESGCLSGPDVMSPPALAVARQVLGTTTGQPETAPAVDRATVCICGHPAQQHFEDCCQVCDCGDYLVPEAAREMIAHLHRAVLAKQDGRRATTLRERADYFEGVLRNAADPGSDPRYWSAISDVIKGLRQQADEQPETETAPGPQDLSSDQLRAKVFEWQGSYLDEVKVRQARDAEVARLRAENAELGRQLACVRGDVRDMEAHVREQDAEFERLRRLAAEAQQPTPAPAEEVPAVFADGGVNDIRELYAVHEAITASGGQLTRHVHRAVDALRAVWDRELRREQQRNARRPTP